MRYATKRDNQMELPDGTALPSTAYILICSSVDVHAVVLSCVFQSHTIGLVLSIYLRVYDTCILKLSELMSIDLSSSLSG